jgi:hypothetical protein
VVGRARTTLTVLLALPARSTVVEAYVTRSAVRLPLLLHHLRISKARGLGAASTWTADFGKEAS